MTEEKRASEHFEQLLKHVENILKQLDKAEEEKWKAACELQSKVFENERIKSLKIEDKAYKLVTYLVILLPAVVSVFAWCMATVSPKIDSILLVKNGHVNSMLVYGYLIAITLLIVSIVKTVMILRAREEYSPSASLADYFQIDHPKNTAKDIFQRYSGAYCRASEKRQENNKHRGIEYQNAFLWSICGTLFSCLIGGTTLFFYLSTIQV